MFHYIFLVLVLCMPSIAHGKGKSVLINRDRIVSLRTNAAPLRRPGSCVVEDTWHPVTGEKLGKRVRCGI